MEAKIYRAEKFSPMRPTNFSNRISKRLSVEGDIQIRVSVGYVRPSAREAGVAKRSLMRSRFGPPGIRREARPRTRVVAYVSSDSSHSGCTGTFSYEMSSSVPFIIGTHLPPIRISVI